MTQSNLRFPNISELDQNVWITKVLKFRLWLLFATHPCVCTSFEGSSNGYMRCLALTTLLSNKYFYRKSTRWLLFYRPTPPCWHVPDERFMSLCLCITQMCTYAHTECLTTLKLAICSENFSANIFWSCLQLLGYNFSGWKLASASLLMTLQMKVSTMCRFLVAEQLLVCCCSNSCHLCWHIKWHTHGSCQKGLRLLHVVLRCFQKPWTRYWYRSVHLLNMLAEGYQCVSLFLTCYGRIALLNVTSLYSLSCVICGSRVVILCIGVLCVYHVSFWDSMTTNVLWVIINYLIACQIQLEADNRSLDVYMYCRFWFKFLIHNYWSCVHTHKHVHVHVRMYTHTHTHVRIYTHTYTHMYMFIYLMYYVHCTSHSNSTGEWVITVHTQQYLQSIKLLVCWRHPLTCLLDV